MVILLIQVLTAIFYSCQVWYHSCPSRGKGCGNTRLKDQGGCAIWYDEKQVSSPKLFFLSLCLYLSVLCAACEASAWAIWDVDKYGQGNCSLQGSQPYGPPGRRTRTCLYFLCYPPRLSSSFLRVCYSSYDLSDWILVVSSRCWRTSRGDNLCHPTQHESAT